MLQHKWCFLRSRLDQFQLPGAGPNSEYLWTNFFSLSVLIYGCYTPSPALSRYIQGCLNPQNGLWWSIGLWMLLSIQQRCNSSTCISRSGIRICQKNGFKRTVSGENAQRDLRKLSKGPALPQPGASVELAGNLEKVENKILLSLAKKVENKWLDCCAFHGSTEP